MERRKELPSYLISIQDPTAATAHFSQGSRITLFSAQFIFAGEDGTPGADVEDRRNQRKARPLVRDLHDSIADTPHRISACSGFRKLFMTPSDGASERTDQRMVRQPVRHRSVTELYAAGDIFPTDSQVRDNYLFFSGH